VAGVVVVIGLVGAVEITPLLELPVGATVLGTETEVTGPIDDVVAPGMGRPNLASTVWFVVLSW
jgi:hypothetical protein